jgi:hypothetical protein
MLQFIYYFLFIQFPFLGIFLRLDTNNTLFKTIFTPEMSRILSWTKGTIYEHT